MIAAIVQARLGSSRLPNKILKPILGRPMIWHIINRICQSKFLEKIIVAIPISDATSELEHFLQKNKSLYFFGNEQDVLDRYYKCAKEFNVDIIVRITADDPFKDPEIVDKAISLFLEKAPMVDYVANCSYDGSIKATYPEGLDVEVFSISCLEKMWKSAKKKSEREHVTPFLFSNKTEFSIAGFENNEDLSHLRWTVDYDIDYRFVTQVYNYLYHKKNIFLMNDILELLNRNPSLGEMNTDIIRHEGYYRSLESELE
jgi:spore coat polysaccharide biosynthesis protein SpsF (cytidylyltransferase family)